MNEQQRFFALLKVAKRKLWKKRLSKYIHIGLVTFGFVTLFLMLLARIVVITHPLEKSIIIFLVTLISIAIFAFLKRPSNEEATSYYGEFIMDNDVSTTLHFMEDQTIMAQLQRTTTLEKMKKASIVLRTEKTTFIYWKPILAFALFLTITVTLYFLPNDTMKKAIEKEIEEEIVEKAKEDIEKIAEEDQSEKLKELGDDTKELKESKELLEQILKQEAKLEKEKQSSEANEQKLKELTQDLKGLDELSDALNTHDSKKLDAAIKNLQDKESQSLSDEEKQALEELFAEVLEQDTPDLSEISDEQLDELLTALADQLNNLMESANSLENLLALQEELQNVANTLLQSMYQNGLSSTEQLAFGEQSQSHGQNQSNNQGSPQQGNNSGNGATNSSNENGNGSGSGNGSGNGAGSGSGSGGGTGSGSGGSGAGFGQGSRELTIPERIEGNENIEKDFGELGNGKSKFQSSEDGLVIEGNVRSYEEVYGQYRESYRNSVDRMELPTYLEDVVRDYFSDLDPKGE